MVGQGVAFYPQGPTTPTVCNLGYARVVGGSFFSGTGQQPQEIAPRQLRVISCIA